MLINIPPVGRVFSVLSVDKHPMLVNYHPSKGVISVLSVNYLLSGGVISVLGHGC